MSSVLHTIALLVLVCLISVNGLYFHVPEGTEKCFLEDVSRTMYVCVFVWT